MARLYFIHYLNCYMATFFMTVRIAFLFRWEYVKDLYNLEWQLLLVDFVPLGSFQICCSLLFNDVIK